MSESELLRRMVADLSPKLRSALAAELAKVEQVESKIARSTKPMDLQSELNRLAGERRAIENNQDWAPSGKAKKFAELDTQRAQVLDRARVDYAAEMVRLKRTDKELKAKRLEADAKAAQAWDYPRLQYNRGKVEAQIAKAQSLGELAELYSQAARSGDLHLRRAWAEFAPGLIGARFTGDESASRGDLLRRMAGDLDSLTITDELHEVQAQEAKLAGDVVKLAEQIRAGASAVGSNPFYPNEFERILEGVTVEEKFDSVKFGTYYSVDLGE